MRNRVLPIRKRVAVQPETKLDRVRAAILLMLKAEREEVIRGLRRPEGIVLANSRRAERVGMPREQLAVDPDAQQLWRHKAIAMLLGKRQKVRTTQHSLSLQPVKDASSSKVYSVTTGASS